MGGGEAGGTGAALRGTKAAIKTLEVSEARGLREYSVRRSGARPRGWLLFDPRVNSFSIAARVSAGIAILQGTVRTLAAKRAAQQVAEHTVGVAEVKNDIDVDRAQ